MSQLQSRTLDSICEIEPEAWRSIYGDTPEGFDYFQACEQATPPSFSFSALGAFNDDRLVAGWAG